MSDSAFPALGFNPAQGNVVAVEDLSKNLNNAHVLIKDAHDALKAIAKNADAWTGAAASAFVAHVDLLPEYLDKGQLSLGKAANALATWASKLNDHQERAHGLEREAKAAYTAATEADFIAQQAKQVASNPIAYDPHNPSSVAAATQTAQHHARAAEQAASAANGAWGKLDEIRHRAQKLKEQWNDDADACASSIRKACEDAPREAFMESIGDIFGDFGRWLRAWGEELGDFAGAVSAVAGVLAFIPLFTPFAAPLALASGFIALGAHANDFVVNEKWDDANSYVTLVGDIAGVVPGISALAKGFDEALDFSTKGGQALATGRIDGLNPIKITPEHIYRGAGAFADNMAEPSKFSAWVGKKALGAAIFEDPDLAIRYAKGFETAMSVSLQFPTAASLFESSDDGDDMKDAVGIPSAILAGLSSGGKPWHLR